MPDRPLLARLGLALGALTASAFATLSFPALTALIYIGAVIAPVPPGASPTCWAHPARSRSANWRSALAWPWRRSPRRAGPRRGLTRRLALGDGAADRGRGGGAVRVAVVGAASSRSARIPRAGAPAFQLSSGLCTAAAAIPGTLVHDLVHAGPGSDAANRLRIGHPSGIMVAEAHAGRISIVRTARRLMEGHVYVPAAPALPSAAPAAR